MTSITVPIGNIRFDCADDGASLAPEQWLKQVIEQADHVLDISPELEARAIALKMSWPANIGFHCRSARQSAYSAIQAFSDEDMTEAMLAAFKAGREFEKAVAALAIFGGLKYMHKRVVQTQDAGKKGGEKPGPAKEINKGFVQRIYRDLTPAEQQGGLALNDWLAKFETLTGETVHKDTMSTYLQELGYRYKGQHNKTTKTK